MPSNKLHKILQKQSLGREPADVQNSYSNSWQLTYLDTITLLLAFIIIMAGIAGVNLFIIESPQKTLRSPVEGTRVVETPIAELEQDLAALLADKIEEQALVIETDDRELRMHFRGSSFYRVGEAELLPSGQAIIDRILEAIHTLYFYQFNVDVEGHADSTPIQNIRFPSNWELSVARASNIVRYFVETGFEPERLKASGYSDTFPIAPNYDEEGNPIPENQDMNRRVVIRLYY
jgi:chemotaxis protein MotB